MSHRDTDHQRDDISGTDVGRGFQRERLHINAEKRPNIPRKSEKHLGEAEMKYLLEGEPGTHNEANLDKQIKNKRSDLRIRIQRLINDIALMEYGGYIEDNDETWNELMKNWEYPGDRIYSSEISELKNTLTTAETWNFDPDPLLYGYKFGLALRILSGSAHRSERGASFLWGLILAYCVTDSGQLPEEAHNYNVIIQKLQEYAKRHFDKAISFESEEEVKEKTKESRAIRAALEEFGIEPTIDASLVIQRAVRSGEYDEEDDGSKRVGGREIDRSLARTVVKDKLKERQFKECVTIAKGLKEECNQIEKASAPGVTAVEVLRSVWDMDNPSSVDIAQNISSSSYQRQVTQTLNKLSEEGKNPSSGVTATYQHGPIVEWYSSTEKPDAWKLTRYGELLCYFCFEENEEINWIHKMKLTNEASIITSAMDVEELKDNIEFIMRGAKPILNWGN